MREFRPTVRSSTLRVLLAGLIAVVLLGTAGSLMAVILGASPVSYTVSGGALVVRSGDIFFGQRAVALADLAEARVVLLRGGRRAAGTALPGYCVGRFSYAELGAVWQATDCGGRAVLLRDRNVATPIVVTPPDPEGFLASLERREDLVITLPPPRKGPLFLIALIMVPMMIIVVVMVGAVMLFGPSRMRYLVGDGALEVKTIFGRNRWSTAGAQAKGYTPQRLWRVAGSGMPGYYTGLFREDGKSTRVYATELERVILFEGPARVILSPEDRGGFLQALRDEGVDIERPHV